MSSSARMHVVHPAEDRERRASASGPHSQEGRYNALLRPKDFGTHFLPLNGFAWHCSAEARARLAGCFDRDGVFDPRFATTHEEYEGVGGAKIIPGDNEYQVYVYPTETLGYVPELRRKGVTPELEREDFHARIRRIIEQGFSLDRVFFRSEADREIARQYAATITKL